LDYRTLGLSNLQTIEQPPTYDVSNALEAPLYITATSNNVENSITFQRMLACEQ